jgi:hypothetical protein
MIYAQNLFPELRIQQQVSQQEQPILSKDMLPHTPDAKDNKDTSEAVFSDAYAEIKQYTDKATQEDTLVDEAIIPPLITLLQMIPNVHVTEQLLLENSRFIVASSSKLRITHLFSNKLDITILYPHGDEPLGVTFHRTFPKKAKEALFITIHFSPKGDITGGLIAIAEKNQAIEDAAEVLTFDTHGKIIPKSSKDTADNASLDFPHILAVLTDEKRQNERFNLPSLLAE